MSFACGVQTGSVSVALRDELLAPVEHAPSHLVEHLLDPLDNDPLLLIRCEIDEAGPWQHGLDVLHAAAVGGPGALISLLRSLWSTRTIQSRWPPVTERHLRAESRSSASA